ncbi:MAG: endonuclease/exonuclease/phosphatase family protein [Elusimicrobia bacterium]|nr:endonuclease/exonuclease/phosphatase family protein [Elusimicrobiota bacterium]
MTRLLLTALLACTTNGEAAPHASDLSGVWSDGEGTRLVLRHRGGGEHEVEGLWRGGEASGEARLLPGAEFRSARVALSLRSSAGAGPSIWDVSLDRTALRRGRARLSREVRPGYVRLKVMTYNIKGIRHLAHVGSRRVDLPGPFHLRVPDVDANPMGPLAAFIRKEQPDLVALQEVDRLRLPAVDSQAEDLAKRTGYEWRYAPASIAGFDGPGPIDVGREHGNAVLWRPSPRLSVLGGRTHRLPGAPGAEPRNALEIRLQAGGRSIAFVSTHFASKGQDQRALQAGHLSRALRGPTLLLGDLNARPNADELAPLRAGCEDAFDRGYAGGPVGTIGLPEEDRRIDYVLSCGLETRVLSSWVAGTDGDAIEGFSDHRAIVSVIEVAAGALRAAR